MDKVAIVTGAAGVLGETIARAFGKAGYRVVVSDLRAEPLDRLAASINEGPGQAVPYAADIRDFDRVKAMVQDTIAGWKRIDVLAAVGGQGLGRLSGTRKEKLLIEHTDEDWDLVIETNLKGTFHCIKAVAGPMMEQRDGHIIIMGSNIGTTGRTRAGSYGTSKAGLYGLMKVAALELGEYNIKVNVVNPGRVAHPGDVVDRNIQESLLKRIQDAEEVADFYVYLAGMRNVSGQIFNLDSRIMF
ncbi:MAG: SDR family oxidoreductase [Chloroflexi bacterium]|nr:SDR family oxidoreductase [Chloroflexota bacterium]